jgi:hypothetical protein
VLNESALARPSDAHNGDDDVGRTARSRDVSILSNSNDEVNAALIPQVEARDLFHILWRVTIVGARPTTSSSHHISTRGYRNTTGMSSTEVEMSEMTSGGQSGALEDYK